MKQILSRALFAGALAFVLCSPVAFADTGDIGVGVKGSTLGIGGEVTVGLTPGFNLRSGYNGFTYDGTASESDIKYDYSLKLSSIPVLLDWHPFDASGFRLTAGALFNSNEVKATGTPSGTYKIGDVTYLATDVGTLTGKVTFNDVAPFLGIGWGNAVGKNSALSLAFDIGVVFQESPKVSLVANGGTLVNDSTFKSELAKEENNLKHDIDGFKYYPVIALGLTYQL
jgi:hypothetical protein